MKKSITVFENGVWFYDKELVKNIKDDFNDMFNKSELLEDEKVNIFKRFFRAL